MGYLWVDGNAGKLRRSVLASNVDNRVRPVGPWDRAQSPEVKAHVEGQLGFNKGVQTIWWRKPSSSSGAGPAGCPRAEDKRGPYFTV